MQDYRAALGPQYVADWKDTQMYQTECSRTDLWHTDMEVLSDSTERL